MNCYSVIRVCFDQMRGETINVGIIGYEEASNRVRLMILPGSHPKVKVMMNEKGHHQFYYEERVEWMREEVKNFEANPDSFPEFIDELKHLTNMEFSPLSNVVLHRNSFENILQKVFETYVYEDKIQD